MNNTTQETVSGAINAAHAAVPTTQDRSPLIVETVTMAMNAAYGTKTNEDQQVARVLGELVKTKLLSAEDSYRLRDQLNDSESLSRLIDKRIELALQRRAAIH